MSKYYAQITAAGVVVGVSQLSDDVNDPQLVPITEYDADLLGRPWDGEKFGERPKAGEQAVTVPDWLESLTESEYQALETRAGSDYLVLQFLKVSELRGFVDPDSDLTVAALARIGTDIAPGKKSPVSIRE